MSLGHGDGVGYLGALVAVFLAGAISGALTSLLGAFRMTWGETPTLLLTTFAAILIGAIAIKVILGYMDADVSLTAAVVTMIIGAVLPLATTSVRLHAETRVARHDPFVLPFVGASFNALTGLLGIAILLGQALIIHSFSVKRN